MLEVKHVLFYLKTYEGGGGGRVACLRPDPAAQGLIPSIPEIVDAAEVSQRHCLEEKWTVV